MAATSQIHIGEAIKHRLKETGMTKAEFAQRIHCTRQNIYSIFERKELHIHLLRKISEVLDCNFVAMQADENNPYFVALIAENEDELIQLKANNSLKILTIYAMSNLFDASVKQQ
ncbi:MAG: helix-turn-helix domain-containing protein [Candidatus Symbiothrix sp.]|nr:helix-turn-helix domain-containing protein [Candidatus Symbiothrix sp.]